MRNSRLKWISNWVNCRQRTRNLYHRIQACRNK
jgi:hypothetical protein